MSGYPDDQFDEPRHDPRYVQQGRAAVTAPAVFLIINGFLGLALLAALSVPFVFNPDLVVQMLKNLAAQQPPGQQKQDLEQQAADLEKEVNQNRQAIALENGLKLGVGAVLNALAIAGGFAMRSLASYGLSMAGAIVSLLPCATGCCLTGIPFGIWALVALVRPEVKAAFAAARSAPPPNPDDQYMR